MPKVQSTAKILYSIYFALTVLEVVFLLLGGMPLFESMLTAFGTAGTGGFGFKNDSFTSFSPYIQWVVTIFMILFGVNFNAYFLLLLRKFNRAISEEVRGYFAIILVAIGIITANIYSLYNSFGEAVRQAAFQVGSIITTTGFSSCDFDLWPTLSKEILVVLMFIGACAGSTGGGIKVSRSSFWARPWARSSSRHCTRRWWPPSAWTASCSTTRPSAPPMCLWARISSSSWYPSCSSVWMALIW